MNKAVLGLVALVVLVVGGFFLLNNYMYQEKQGKSAGEDSYKDLTYMIEGKPVQLRDGYAESESVSGSAAKIITRYFGNEAVGDLDGDGSADIAFLLTQEGGGSGVFFYAAAALRKGDGYLSVDATIIGDRIAPQPTEIRDGLVIVNYADRAPGEPMTASPSIGKSLYLKLDPNTMQFGEVVQNFEGESAAALTEPQARAIAESSCIKGGGALAAGVHNKGTQTWWFDANLNATQPGCSPACVVSEVTKTAEINWRCTGLIVPK